MFVYEQVLVGSKTVAVIEYLIKLKQEIDCRTNLFKKFCSTVNFYDWRSYFKNYCEYQAIVHKGVPEPPF